MTVAKRIWIQALLVTTGGASTALSQGVELKDRPWHMANTAKYYSESAEFELLELDYQLLNDLKSIENPNSFFVVPLSGKINGVVFYVGFTSKECMATSSGVARRIDSPCYRFTRFSEASETSVRVAKDGHLFASEHEGPHAGVGIKCLNKSGVYTIRMKSTKVVRNEAADSLIELSIVDRSTNTESEVGAAYFPGYPAVVSGYVASFIEVTQGYDKSRDRWHAKDEEKSTEMPDFRLGIGKLSVNGNAVEPAHLQYYYRKDVPQKGRVELFRDNEALKKPLDARLHVADSMMLEITNVGHKRREVVEVIGTDKATNAKVEAYIKTVTIK